MGVLIDDLLSFARMSRHAIEKQTVSPGMLVRDALSVLERERKDRQLDIRVGDLPQCQADPTLLRQVFVNLLSNAFKFSRDRAPAVIEVGCMMKDGETAYFVSDNGVGFDMRFTDKLFGVFQRLHANGDFEGTGVGLAIVHKIVQRHGGRIWAEGMPGGGATFYFTL
jgi:light-regulated signal transduction histidine kinase (bacteriophytochrome)